MNKTLMEKARCMLSGVGLGKYLWAEAVGTACYLVNRSPSSTLDNKTPQEVWTGKEPSLTHLKVFGCDTLLGPHIVPFLPILFAIVIPFITCI
jgi:hypothetical protein